MDSLAGMMATYEAELREVAGEHGGEVEVWRPEPAEVVQLVIPHQDQVEQDELDGEPLDELGVVIDADFDEIDPDDDETDE